MPATIPDFAGALHEWMQIPRKQRRVVKYAVCLIPLAFGIFAILLAIVR